VKPAVGQNGFVLANALMLFAVISLSMSTVLGIATRELARTSIHESLDATARTAQTALAQATATVAIESTSASVVHTGTTPDGTHYEVSVRYLGATELIDAESLAYWHFLYTSIARSRTGAEVVEQLQVRIPASPPIDPAACLDPGCPLPPLCTPPACDPPLRADAERVAWHLPDMLP